MDYYVAQPSVPADHTEAVLETSVGSVRLGLKLRPETVVASASEDWQIIVERDLRVPALVSLLKAAHLTLFELLGYKYSLSAGGHFMGWTVLGDYFIQNSGMNKIDIVKNAAPHFKQFVNMVRPVAAHTPALEGTMVDKRLYICQTATAITWAVIVFVRTSHLLHAVLAPVFEHPDGVDRFLRFLKSDNAEIECRLATYSKGGFLVAPKPVLLSWPRAELS